MRRNMESKLVSRQPKRRVTPEENNDFVMDIDEEKKQSEPKGFFKLLKTSSMEFCQSTSLHGLQYVGEKQRHVLERMFWLTVFLLSSSVAAYYIYKIWDKWNKSPVFVSFNEVQTSVRDIPFPAITICPQIKVMQTLFNYTTMSKKENLTDEELEKMQFSQLICKDYRHKTFAENDTVDSRAIDFIEQVAPTLSDVIGACMWRSSFRRCDRLFTSVLTDEGLCYTFNTLPSEELFKSDTIQHSGKHLNHSKALTWSLEGGYFDSEMTGTFPRRALTNGAYGGLALLIIMKNEDVDPICSPAIHGVQVLLHNPADFPNVEDLNFRVPLNRHVLVGIRPRMMVTSERLRAYTPEKRQCYFSTERNLRYFNVYTQQNCDLECFINYTLQGCGCVKYYMPRDQNMPICGPAKRWCLMNITGNFAADVNGLFKCNCMPACTELSYDVETSQAEFSWLDTAKAISINYTELVKYKLTEVSFYLKERQFVKSRRGELFGLADFLASCGGLLGFYLGFSLLSVVEIIYFFTVRLFCNFRADKKKHPAP